MNPRGSSDRPAEEPSRRLTRRGQTYGRRSQAADGSFTDLPSNGVGLLFVAFVASIIEQFEFIIAIWAEVSTFPNATAPDGAIDPIIAQTPTSPLTLPSGWEDPSRVTVAASPGPVKMLGGEYFFAPSITTLRSVAPPT